MHYSVASNGIIKIILYSRLATRKAKSDYALEYEVVRFHVLRAPLCGHYHLDASPPAPVLFITRIIGLPSRCGV